MTFEQELAYLAQEHFEKLGVASIRAYGAIEMGRSYARMLEKRALAPQAVAAATSAVPRMARALLGVGSRAASAVRAAPSVVRVAPGVAGARAAGVSEDVIRAFSSRGAQDGWNMGRSFERVATPRPRPPSPPVYAAVHPLPGAPTVMNPSMGQPLAPSPANLRPAATDAKTVADSTGKRLVNWISRRGGPANPPPAVAARTPVAPSRGAPVAAPAAAPGRVAPPLASSSAFVGDVAPVNYRPVPAAVPPSAPVGVGPYRAAPAPVGNTPLPQPSGQPARGATGAHVLPNPTGVPPAPVQPGRVIPTPAQVVPAAEGAGAGVPPAAGVAPAGKRRGFPFFRTAGLALASSVPIGMMTVPGAISNAVEPGPYAHQYGMGQYMPGMVSQQM